MSIETWIKIWRAGFAFSVFGVVQFLLCVGIAMFIYPGGTLNDRTTVGYSQTENYLSDLGRRESISGTNNQTGAIIFNGSIILLGFSVIPFFLFITTQAHDQVGMLATTAAIGVLSACSLIYVGVCPVDFYPFKHVMGICFWLIALILLTGIHGFALLTSKVQLTWLALFSVALMLVSVFYAYHSMKTGAALFRGEEMPVRAVLLQKFMVLSAMGWFLANSLTMLMTNDFSEYQDRVVGDEAEAYVDSLAGQMHRQFYF